MSRVRPLAVAPPWHGPKAALESAHLRLAASDAQIATRRQAADDAQRNRALCLTRREVDAETPAPSAPEAVMGGGGCVHSHRCGYPPPA